MKKLFPYLVIFPAACIFLSGCSGYLSYHTKTSCSLKFYKNAVLNKYTIDVFTDSLYRKSLVCGKKKAKKYRPMHQAAYDEIRSQMDKFGKVDQKLKKYFDRHFSDNDCANGGEVIVFTRKLIVPQTEYSHLATPYRNESYIFYILNDYDPKTGFGRYYQTDAYYPRDAFSFQPMDLCPDNPAFSKNLEFFTGVFYLTYNDILRAPVLCLLSPENDLNDKKVFTMERTTDNENEILKLKLTKAFEYKLFNYYPIMDSHYTLIQRDGLSCKPDNSMQSVFSVEYEALKSMNTSNALFTMQRKQESAPLPDRDYFYPLKGDTLQQDSIGWVYFGMLDSTVNNISKVMNETFFQFRKFIGINNNEEIKKLKRLERLIRHNNNPVKKRKRTVKSFDIIKMRAMPGENMAGADKFEHDSIIGEAYPDNVYAVTELKIINKYFIWIKIQKTEWCTKN